MLHDRISPIISCVYLEMPIDWYIQLLLTDVSSVVIGRDLKIYLTPRVAQHLFHFRYCLVNFKIYHYLRYNRIFNT